MLLRNVLGRVSAAQLYLAGCIASGYGVYFFPSFSVEDERIARRSCIHWHFLHRYDSSRVLLHVDRAET